MSLLAAEALSVVYPPVRALDGAAFTLAPGEIHALMGENGAGKSTLIRVLTGLVHPLAGTMTFGGRPYHPRSVHDAERAGISAVHQEIDLVPTMSVEENLLLRRQPTRLGLVRHRALRARAAEALARVGISTAPARGTTHREARPGPHPRAAVSGPHHTVDPSAALGSLSVGLQQMVAIARALDTSARVLILDEPTSSLDRAETRTLFGLLRDLRSKGLAVVFVSHFLDQVYEISDRITVLRNGATVGSWTTPDLPRPALIEAMTGRAFTHAPPRPAGDPADPAPSPTPVAVQPPPAPAALTFKALSRRHALAPTSGHVASGESLGLAGLLGSGRSELARLLFGADTPDSGEILAPQARLTPGSVRSAIEHGIAFTPEDRKAQGLVLELSVRENILLALQARRPILRPIPPAEQARLVEHYIRALNIRTSGPEAPVGSLSGGNQQKVLLARWLAVQPRVIILDEPTRGVDVGARAEIETLINGLRADGLAVILISSELDEIVRLCGRVMVMRDRACVGELSGTSVTERDLLAMIAADPAPEPAP